MSGAVLILGARSDIGLAIAHEFAAHGHPIHLAARGPATLEPARADLALRHGVEVTLHPFDALDYDSHEAFLDALPALPEIAVCVVGFMGDEAQSEADMGAARRVMRSNYEGPASILGLIANRFEARGRGTVVGISSVAGDRGRAANYVYGSAKAGFTAWLSGLRNRLAGKGVHVLTVKPGFVATAMTQGMDLPARLTAEPAEVGRAVRRAVRMRRNVIYVRPVWRLVMAVIGAIPEAVFKRLRI